MKIAIHFRAVLFFSLLALCSCNAQQTVSTPMATNTPDLCGPSAIPGQVEKVNKNMREFDDASLIAANTPRGQLPPVISNMQRIRRETEDQVVPSCLAVLKQIQLVYMKTEVETLVAFLGGANQDILNKGTALAHQQHNQYALEYARLLGLTTAHPVTNTPNILLTKTPQPLLTATASK